jgi:hypothetical protein
MTLKPSFFAAAFPASTGSETLYKKSQLNHLVDQLTLNTSDLCADLDQRAQTNHLVDTSALPPRLLPFPRRGRPIRPTSQPGNKGHRPRWLDALLSAMTKSPAVLERISNVFSYRPEHWVASDRRVPTPNPPTLGLNPGKAHGVADAPSSSRLPR